MDYGVVSIGGGILSMRVYNMSHHRMMDDNVCVELRWMVEYASMGVRCLTLELLLGKAKSIINNVNIEKNIILLYRIYDIEKLYFYF